MNAGLASWRQRLPWAALLALSLTAVKPSPAAAETAPRVRVDCAQLTSEQAAEVEARVQATLLTAALDARVTLSCQGQQATVELDVGAEQVQHQIALTASDPRDSLVGGVEEAWRLLSRRRARATSAPPSPSEAEPSLSQGASVPPPSLDTPVDSQPVPPQPRLDGSAAPASPKPRGTAQLYALGTVESWPGAFAPGASVGVGYRLGSLTLAAHGGASVMTPSQRTFGVTEWNAALNLAWQPTWALGLRCHVGFGPSVLVVSPRGATPRAGTTSATWFAEVALTRPLWVGRLALLPSLGARAFAHARAVNVDNRARLSLEGAVPSLGLGLLYVVN